MGQMPFPSYNQCSVKSPKKKRSTDPNQRSGLLSSSTPHSWGTGHCTLYVSLLTPVLSTFSRHQNNCHTSSGSLNTVKIPSNSGLGVYSKSSTSADIISRLQIKNPYKWTNHAICSQVLIKQKKPLQRCKSNITHTTSRLETRTLLEWA